MAAALTASFILKLEDQLSNGLAALSKKLEELAKLGRQVELSGLDHADQVLDKLGTAAEGASHKVGGISRSARQATEDINRLNNTIRVSAAGVAVVPPSLARANATAAITTAIVAATRGGVIGGGGGGGIGGGGGGIGAPFGGPSPLLLAPPGSTGGIPLAEFNFATRAALGLGRFGAAAGAARAEMAALAHQVQAVGHHTRELGEASLTAFATGFGLEHVIGEYAKYENTLRHIAITAGTPKEMIPNVVAELSRQYDRLALASGQSSEKISEAAQFLITTGIGRANVDKLLPLVARASTAYNTEVGDSVQAIFSLKENLHVADGDMAGAISAAALAGKEGHFSFADLSRFLPDIAPLAANAGLSGGVGAKDLFAMLETSRRNAGTSGEAETNLRDFLSHLFGAPKRGLGNEFKRYGVDLQKLLLDAEKKGISAPEAVLEQVRRMTEGKTAFEKNLIIGGLFHNQQSATFVRGALNDLEYLAKLREKLRNADSGTIDTDYGKAVDAPAVKLRLLGEKLVQIERRLGEGFEPVLDVLNSTLDKVLLVMDRLDQTSHGAVNKVLASVAGFLGLASVLGVLVPLFKLIGAGVRLILTPIRWLFTALVRIGALARAVLMPVAEGLLFVGETVLEALAAMASAVTLPGVLIAAAVAAIAGAVYLIYRNWGDVKAWFGTLWTDVTAIFTGVTEFLLGVFTGNMALARKGVEDAWAGIKQFFVDLWAGATAPFEAAVKAIEDGVNRARSALGLGPAAPPSDGRRDRDGGPPAPGMPAPIPPASNPFLATPTAYRPGADGGQLAITIKVDQDGRVVGVVPQTPDRWVRPTVDRGNMALRT